MLRFKIGGAVAALALLAAATASPAAVLPIDRAAQLFGARPSAFAADLSPSGDKLVFLIGLDGARTGARVLDLKTRAIKNVIASTGKPDLLDWCEFATEIWLICRYSGNLPYNDLIIPFSRLVAINLVTNELKKLSSRDTPGTDGLRQNDGAVLDWLPDDRGGAILMARTHIGNTVGGRTRSSAMPGLAVERISLATMKGEGIEPARNDARFYLTDGKGNVRLVAIEEYRQSDVLTGKITFRYRPRDGGAWRDLGAYISKTSEGMYPLAIDADDDSVLYVQKLNGRDALYRMKLDGSGASSLVAKHDQVDISGVVRVARGKPVIGYRYTDDRPRIEYTDPNYHKLFRSLARALPDVPLIDFAGASRDGSKLLIHAASDTDPGGYYVLDRATMKLAFELDDRVELGGMKLAKVKPIAIPVGDGKTIPGYLTMSGDGPATGRPAIVLPHGGPSSRDEWGFDWLAQFLAARGYVVIQPNYRGSAGYGDEFLGDNAFRDWRTAINDISAAADYMVQQKLADPTRLAIVGWSYGGYAALQSAVVFPNRYKAVVAIAPVTDLSALRRDAIGFTDEDLTKDFVGKGPNLRAGSPRHHAAAIKAPVLLVHGDLDANVRIAHSQRMNGALKRAGVPVELLTYKDLGHQLDDVSARTEMLTRIGELLERTIGH